MLSRFSRILVVDDSLTTRKAVRSMLDGMGLVNVDEAADGADALTLITTRSYALVISDWLMEPMSGIELLMKLRRIDRYAGLSFIMMTAQTKPKFMEVARDAGATHYLAKPFDQAALKAKLDMLGKQMIRGSRS